MENKQLEKKFKDSIYKSDGSTSSLGKLGASITLEHMEAILEWVEISPYFFVYDKGWTNDDQLEYLTTKELIKLYFESLNK